jgi:hypothetical protein
MSQISHMSHSNSTDECDTYCLYGHMTSMTYTI